MAGTILTACMDDDKYKEFNPKECWGTIVGTQEQFDILSDSGERLHVTENRDPLFRVKDGMRIIASYAELEATETSNNIRVNALKQLLTKVPSYSSQLLPGQIDSLGRDPIEPLQAWFGADRYLNITFMLYIANGSQKHMISLLIDSVRSTPEKVYVLLRHNAFGDKPLYQGLGHVSFDLNNLLQNRNELDLVLEWTNYDNTPGSITGTLKRHQTSMSGLSTDIGASASSILLQ